MCICVADADCTVSLIIVLLSIYDANIIFWLCLVILFLTYQLNSALHLSGVAKSSTSFGWSKGGKVTAAGWQVTLCDPMWHVISCNGEVMFDEELLHVL